MKNFLFTAALFGASATGLFADTVAYLQGPGTANLSDGSYAVSPYTGSLGVAASGGTNQGNGTTTGATITGGTGVQLFCDDFPDHAVFGQDWNAQVTSVTGSGSTSPTRFGASNPNTNSYPAGVALYEEVAWLFDQVVANNESSTNQIAIQEAVWHLTDSGTSPTSSSGNTGANLTYLQWIADAKTDSVVQTSGPNAGESQVVAGFATTTYSQWYVVTPDNYATAGSTQEFLAYNSAGTIHSTQVTPEPATFVLFGSGLLAVGFLGRRRKQSNS